MHSIQCDTRLANSYITAEGSVSPPLTAENLESMLSGSPRRGNVTPIDVVDDSGLNAMFAWGALASKLYTVLMNGNQYKSRRWNPALKQEDDDASVDEHSDYCSSTIYSKTTALEHARICELFDALPFRDAPFTSSGPVITCKVVVEDPAIASALRAKSRLYDSGVSMPDLEDIYNERRTKKLNDPDNESIDSIDALNDAASMLCHRPIEEGSGYIFGYPDEIQPKNPGAIREGLHSIMRSTKSIINKTFAMMRK